jgi:hypothetical protein
LDDEHVKMDLSKMQELTDEACGTGSVLTILWTCTEVKISVQQKGLLQFRSTGWNHNMQKHA